MAVYCLAKKWPLGLYKDASFDLYAWGCECVRVQYVRGVGALLLSPALLVFISISAQLPFADFPSGRSCLPYPKMSYFATSYSRAAVRGLLQH